MMWFCLQIYFLIAFSNYISDGCVFLHVIKETIISGVKAKTKVRCSEETAVVHWRREPSAERLSAGWVELVGSLLVQVLRR